MLCINLFTIAKETSIVIGGPTQIITVRKGGMTLMKPSAVSDLEQRTGTFNAALANLVLACPDLSMHRDEFHQLLLKFGAQVEQLREHYFQLAANEELDSILNDPDYRGQPFPTLPGGMLIARAGDGQAEIIPHEQTRAFLQAVAKQAAKKGKKPEKSSRSRTSKGQR